MSNNNFLVAYNKQNQLIYFDLVIDQDKQVLCIPVYEDLVFTALFLKGQRVLTPFTSVPGFSQVELEKFFQEFQQQERYIISSEFFDSSLIKWSEIRKQNSPFCPLFAEPVMVVPPPPVEVLPLVPVQVLAVPGWDYGAMWGDGVKGFQGLPQRGANNVVQLVMWVDGPGTDNFTYQWYSDNNRPIQVDQGYTQNSGVFTGQLSQGVNNLYCVFTDHNLNVVLTSNVLVFTLGVGR